MYVVHIIYDVTASSVKKKKVQFRWAIRHKLRGFLFFYFFDEREGRERYHWETRPLMLL